jgi:hypothetical protein
MQMNTHFVFNVLCMAGLGLCGEDEECFFHAVMALPNAWDDHHPLREIVSDLNFVLFQI